jgi:hypothetical protein
MDLKQVRLGKKLGVVEDRRTFMAADLLRPGEFDFPLPPRHRVGGNLERVPMFMNHQKGNCTRASQGHAVLTMERSSGQRGAMLTDQHIMDAYARVGYRVGPPEVDEGAYELDALNDWRHNGIGLEKDGTPHKIKAFVRVDHTNHEEVIRAHYVFGGLKVCAGLPLSAADQINRGEPWTVSTTRNWWGSWGGHSMYSHIYDLDARRQPTGGAPLDQGIGLWTWGQLQWLDWEWWDKYVDEVYAVISEDYIRTRSRTTPQGFDEARLDRMLAAL